MEKAMERARGEVRARSKRPLLGISRRLLFASLLVTIPLLLATAAVVAVQVKYDGLILDGVRIGSVPVGGMSREAAAAELASAYGDVINRPLTLAAGDKRWPATPAQMGASLDIEAAVDAAYAVGRAGNLLERLSTQVSTLRNGHLFGGPGVKVDQAKAQESLAQRALEFDREVRDAQLLVRKDLSVQVTPSVVGRRLDTETALATLEEQIPGGASLIELPVILAEPRHVESDFDDARDALARIYSGSVNLEFEGQQWTLYREEIASLISVEMKGDRQKPVVSIDQAPLRQLVARTGGEVDQPRMDGRLDWNRGKLRVLTPGQDGRKLNQAAALSMLVEAITGEIKTVALPVETDRAVGGSLALSTLGIVELVESASTSFAGSVPAKSHNIKLATSRLNGVVVRPGEIFSFNKELGPTTLKSGFQVGFGITVKDGGMQTVPSVAGGICQVSTTLLHAVFWSGYQIEERYPHLYWIASYGVPPKGMLGLDATVDDPNLDFKFMNNSGSYLLVQSGVEGDKLTFSLYGTKPDWRIAVEGPIINSVTKADPAVVRQEEPSMPQGKEIWVERANDGQDVTIIRRVTQGEDVRTLELRSPYRPSRNVILVGTKGEVETPLTPAQTASPSGTAEDPAPARPGAGDAPGAEPAGAAQEDAGPSTP